MSVDLYNARDFSFEPRPLPVPGDLRITWRLSLILLMLKASRARRASLAKLHVLNYASRSVIARQRLLSILEGSMPTLFWQMPVEPAFGRALDFTVGEGFAIWQRVSSRSGLELTVSGSKAAEAVASRDDLLIEEKAFLVGDAKNITEAFVSRLLSVPRTR
jgi:hypothetical protein